MRNLLFSPRLKPGWELYVVLRCVLVTVLLLGVGLFASHFFDVVPNPFLAALFAIVSVSVLWFWVFRKYRLAAAFDIATGGFCCFAAFDTWDASGWHSAAASLFGFIVIVRYYSEGPTRT